MHPNFRKLIIVLMTINICLVAGINLKAELIPNAQTRGGVSSLLFGLFISLAFMSSIVTKEVVLRGTEISKAKRPKLYLISVTTLFLIAFTFFMTGVLTLLG